ncbi:hypothetical protein DPMN_096642 [Dreissena polymorpha]|uniref:Uncharacterized protein n=1 Tax=Dreissena polymorpha TaxID=45954 RepID=A0A9D4LA57_DREPO|nr:hypothetical protein DPMN_096642 [Dreissena polymorpha]
MENNSNMQEMEVKRPKILLKTKGSPKWSYCTRASSPQQSIEIDHCCQGARVYTISHTRDTGNNPDPAYGPYQISRLTSQRKIKVHTCIQTRIKHMKVQNIYTTTNHLIESHTV